ncbi:hypothetical protein [Peristeroidobacter agariperforans]|uniref:hypothetical protein n=1 Tax=Peristeroidobacter agariperforans TaxID=268404 RepID=UPI00101D4603|nr:hypothetical protein [Peristeroidobacter agariperforans]
MNSLHALESNRGRVIVLWACTFLFWLRVVGQLEVLLAAPSWLPPMSDWYSGLIPYPLLVPVQIAILMLMSALAMREMQAGRRASSDSSHGMPWVRRFAVAYFVVMVLRLVFQFARGADNLTDAGGIPVAFHWVLALFLLVLARPSSVSMDVRAKGEPA